LQRPVDVLVAKCAHRACRRRMTEAIVDDSGAAS
jgi:hypothetical protein